MVRMIMLLMMINYYDVDSIMTIMLMWFDDYVDDE